MLKSKARRVQSVEEERLDAGQVKLKQEMIEICHDMINLLAILAKKDYAFAAFQQQLLEAAKQEGWPVPAETDVAESVSSTRTKAGGRGGVGALLETTSKSEEARAQTEVPKMPQKHLDALNALNEKINQLNRYETDLPDSVKKLLLKLQAQVKCSILAVEKDITAEKQQAYKAQVAAEREVTPHHPTNVFKEQSRRENETGRPERSHSCPPNML